MTTDTQTNEDKAERLSEIQSEMLELLDEADKLLIGTGIIGQRAEAYWLDHARRALTKINPYDHTMEDTIAELNGEDDDDETDED